jgi:hypothetical protein
VMVAKHDKAGESKDVATVQDVVGTLVAREGDVIGKYLAREMEDISVDPGAVYEAIIAEIMGAETIDDVLNLPETTDLEEWAEQALEFHGFRVLDSDYEQGAPVYFVIGATHLASNAKVIITCGEQAIMAQMLRLKELGAFPFRAIPQKAKRPNRFGRYPMRIRAAG